MINTDLGVFVDGDGFEYPIDSYLDADGDKCAKEEAAYAIAGAEGRWYTVVLSEFEPLEKGAIQ